MHVRIPLYNREIFLKILTKYGKNVRKSQLGLSNDIQHAYDKNLKFVAEAEVGTGKSFAYLIPTFNKISERRKPFLISTGTIVLQDQLVNKDIPELSTYLVREKFIKDPAVCIIGKGKEHYICEKRLIDFHEKVLKSKKSTLNQQVNDIIVQYDQGIFDRKQFPNVDDHLWNKVNIKFCSSSCELRQCRFRNFRHKRDARDYDFLVCNHQYLLSCLKNSSFSLERFAGLVIDEAHNFESAAYSILGNNKALKDFLFALEWANSNHNYKPQSAQQLVIELYQEIESATIIPGRKEIDWKYKINITSRIKKLASDLANELKNVLIMVTKLSKDLKRREDKLSDDLESLQTFLFQVQSNQEKVFWVQFEKGINHILTPRLYYIPCDIDEILFEKIFSKDNIPVILSSATMSTSTGQEGFDYFIGSLGIDKVRRSLYKDPVSKLSPFDFSVQAGIYYEKDLRFISVTAPEHSEYMKAKAYKTFEIIKAAKGKSLILFTSYEAMDYTYIHIKDRIINELGFNCYKQGNGTNNFVLNKFMEDIDSCLFATGSFWEGIDIKGSALSCVIIDKLPFSVLDPIVQYKIYKLDVEEEEVMKAEMILKLRQGAGRLIRHEDDKGIIAILDSRANKKYYDIVSRSLPNYKIIDSIEDIRSFFAPKIAVAK